MSKAYVILGMKRSGHHALVLWIGNNIPDGTILFNDCSKGWDNKILLPSIYQQPQSQEIAIGNVKDIRNAIFNIEDFDIENLKNHDFMDFLNVKIYAEKYLILVLRDPWNWIASRMKTGGSLVQGMEIIVKRYIQHCECALKSISYTQNKLHIINYNDWFTDETYRASLANTLKLNKGATNNGINILSVRGGGSSFDGTKFQNKAQQMDVLNRWKFFKDSEYFNDLITLIPQKYKDLFPQVKAEYENHR